MFPGDEVPVYVKTFMPRLDLERYREWASRTPFPIALPAVIGCIHYELTFAEGYHQTAIIYDLHRKDDPPANVKGAINLEGRTPPEELTLKLNIVGYGPID